MEKMELRNKTIERRKMPTVKFEKSHGGREKYFPTELKKHMVGDCVIRACAIATGKDYLETMKRLFEIGLEIGNLPNANESFEIFLIENGFVKNKQPRKTNKQYFQVNEFPAEPGVVYVLGVCNHSTAIVDQTHLDTWNCGESTIRSCYSKKL